MIFVKYEFRLGNNLFQWAFARVLSKLSGVPMSASPITLFPATFQDNHPLLEKIDFELPVISYSVDLAEWVEKSKKGNVLVRGFPHNITFFEPHCSWLAPEVAPRPGDYAVASSKDVVLHIRWGDYFDVSGNVGRFGYPGTAFYRLLGSLDYDRCLIVTDTPNNKIVEDVLKHFRGVLVAKDIDHDYRTLYHASRLIMSPSTFSWWAAWSGNGKEIYQPYEMGFWKKKNKFALGLPGPRVKRFDMEGRIVNDPATSACT